MCIILLTMKNCTENTYKQKSNQVIDYINSNLHRPLQLNVTADRINMSQRQLLRIMSSILKEPLYSYITRQRMERAIQYMQTEQISQKELADLVGYDNPQSFSKAFKKQFGISPKVYTDKLKIQLKESTYNSKINSLSPEILFFEGLNLVYIRVWGKYGEEEPYKIAWSNLIRYLKNNDLLTSNTKFIGLSFDDPNVTSPDKCRFYACASVPKTIVPNCEFGIFKLLPGKYAVYTIKGYYENLQDWYNTIWVNNEEKLRHGMSFEEYINFSDENIENYITKIYIPIK